MAYATYTTKALVCGTQKRNTSDSSYLLFTREAGMLFADARSVREEKSRQRYALQDFSLIKVSLVKGKTSWKIGSVESQKNYYHSSIDKSARGSIVNLFRFLRRFLGGEEAVSEIFDLSLSILDKISDKTNHRNFVEEVNQLRLLALLGYVDKKQIPKEIEEAELFSTDELYSKELEAKVHKLHKQAIHASHL